MHLQCISSIRVRGGRSISDVDHAVEQLPVFKYDVTQCMRRCCVYVIAEDD